MSADDSAEMWRLIYDEVQRSLDQQASVLDGIRGRTGLLVSAASVATALLAAPVLAQQGLSGWAVAALLLFGFSMVLAMLILGPRRSWHFTFDVNTVSGVVEDERLEDLVAFRRYIIDYQAESISENDKRLRWLFRLFKWSAIVLVIDIGIWVVALLAVTQEG